MGALAVSEEGRKVYAQAGETPAKLKVEPLEKVQPAAAYSSPSMIIKSSQI
jgi:hypothetical protein